MDPDTDLKHKLKNDLERWATGLVFKTVHHGTNLCFGNVPSVENYEIGHAAVRDYHQTIVKHSSDNQSLLQPPTVRLKNDNIKDVQNAILMIMIYIT